MGKGAKYEMPAWTEMAGGKKKWRKWLDGQASRCFKRAKKWSGASTREQWRQAIYRALRENRGGTGHYSGFPLSLDLTPPWTHALWPSVDHVKDPGTVKVVLETRLVNDMKTILDEGEFRNVVAHLTKRLRLTPELLASSWQPKRDYAKPQKKDEPAPPAKAKRPARRQASRPRRAAWPAKKASPPASA